MLRKTRIKRYLAAILSCAAGVGITVAACGDGGTTAPARCSESTTSSTEAGATSDTVVVAASGTHCGDGPIEVIVVPQPAETETIGQQIQWNRFAFIRTVKTGKFDIRIPIGPVVQLRDGTELRPAPDKFEVGFR